MRETITVSLPAVLRKELDQVTKRERLNRSDVVRDALRRYFAIREFRKLRGISIPYAEKKGFYSDEDIFREIS